MKTNKHFLQWLTVVLLLAVNVLGTMAQGVDALTDSISPHSVCLNSIEPYGVILTDSSTYDWSISNPSAGNISGGTSNLITVEWTKTGNHILYLVETNKYGCVGDSVSILVTVNPLPIVNTLPTTTCSGVATGVVLPVLSDNSLVVDKWDITATVVDPGLTGTATDSMAITDPNVIAGDKFTNTTAAPLTVVYIVTPYTGACSGGSFTITVTVLPEPVVKSITPSPICSGDAVGIELPVASENALVVDKWDITEAVVQSGLTGAATLGSGITDINAIAGDVFMNTTRLPLTVVYTVTPYTGTCKGASFTITVTVLPEPVVKSITPSPICSGDVVGIELPVASENGLVVNKWDITAVIAPGLTGNATQGLALTNPNAIAADVFTNATTGSLTVVYTVTPYTGTCAGASFTITVTVYPRVNTSPIYHN